MRSEAKHEESAVSLSEAEIKSAGQIHSDFALGVRNPNIDVPDFVVKGAERPSQKRFNVYRNNHYASLVEALRKQFPATRKAIDEKTFLFLARSYVRHTPPRSPVMLFYGETFPAFCQEVLTEGKVWLPPFLPAMAQLDYDCRLSYHAADDVALMLSDMISLPPEEQFSMKLTRHPAASWRATTWPLVSIWHDLMDGNPVEESPPHRESTVLISRPALDVLITDLPAGSLPVLEALAQGRPLGEALDVACSNISDFPVADFLARTFTAGAFMAKTSHKL